ncbi:unnamed protein product [Blepharisma stoltei]|uniref:Uncharacterized protein n=1 Tax=Blepharisma stoltei TaxID=1481888 RepID=A0AAU9JAD6_9CILI|nr:unnamed protein product [Blepharisma stoltei]
MSSQQLSPYKALRHRIVQLTTSPGLSCRAKLCKDQRGAVGEIFSEKIKMKSSYHDQFGQTSPIRRPSPIYPKDNVIFEGKCEYVTQSRLNFCEKPYYQNQNRPRSQTPDRNRSDNFLTDAMTKRFEARTEKQDQFANFQISYSTPRTKKSVNFCV